MPKYHVCLYAQPGEVSPDPKVAECVIYADDLDECLAVAACVIKAEREGSESCVEWQSTKKYYLPGEWRLPGISVLSVDECPVFDLTAEPDDDMSEFSMGDFQ